MSKRLHIITAVAGVALVAFAAILGGQDTATWIQTAIAVVAFPIIIYELYVALREFQQNTEQFKHWRKEINAQCKLEVVMFFPHHHNDYVRRITVRQNTPNKFQMAVTNQGDAPARDIWMQVLIEGPLSIIEHLKSIAVS